jgi:hypothetical protein
MQISCDNGMESAFRPLSRRLTDQPRDVTHTNGDHVRRKLLPAIMAALVASAVTLVGGSSPAHASFTAGPPPGYVAPHGLKTSPPESCYVYAFTATFPTGRHLTGSMTECMRVGGVHRAAAQCTDGSIIYGFGEEMQDFRQSSVFCGEWPFGPVAPALYVWGEYHLDW